MLLITLSSHDEYYGFGLLCMWGLFVYCTIKVIAVTLAIYGSVKSYKPLLLLVSFIEFTFFGNNIILIVYDIVSFLSFFLDCC